MRTLRTFSAFIAFFAISNHCKALSPTPTVSYLLRGRVSQLSESNTPIIPTDIKLQTPYLLRLTYDTSAIDNEASPALADYHYRSNPLITFEAEIGSHVIRSQSRSDMVGQLRIFTNPDIADNPKVFFNVGNNVDEYVRWGGNDLTLWTRFIAVAFFNVPAITTDHILNLPDFSATTFGSSSLWQLIFVQSINPGDPNSVTSPASLIANIESVTRIPEPSTPFLATVALSGLFAARRQFGSGRGREE
jgi:hypothetical protein